MTLTRYQFAVGMVACAVIGACSGESNTTKTQSDTTKVAAPTAVQSAAVPVQPITKTADTGAKPPMTVTSSLKPTSSGVYTAAQALAGADIYAGMCQSCHGALGNHTGQVFREHWGGKPLGKLFDYITTNMPKNDPGSMSVDDYTLVLAYLLKLNDIPAGKTELPADYDALMKIVLDTTPAHKH